MFCSSLCNLKSEPADSSLLFVWRLFAQPLKPRLYKPNIIHITITTVTHTINTLCPIRVLMSPIFIPPYKKPRIIRYFQHIWDPWITAWCCTVGRNSAWWSFCSEGCNCITLNSTLHCNIENWTLHNTSIFRVTLYTAL